MGSFLLPERILGSTTSPFVTRGQAFPQTCPTSGRLSAPEIGSRREKTGSLSLRSSNKGNHLKSLVRHWASQGYTEDGSISEGPDPGVRTTCHDGVSFTQTGPETPRTFRVECERDRPPVGLYDYDRRPESVPVTERIPVCRSASSWIGGSGVGTRDNRGDRWCHGSGPGHGRSEWKNPVTSRARSKCSSSTLYPSWPNSFRCRDISYSPSSQESSGSRTLTTSLSTHSGNPEGRAPWWGRSVYDEYGQGQRGRGGIPTDLRGVSAGTRLSGHRPPGEEKNE